MNTLLIAKDVVCRGLAKCRRLRLAGLVTLLYLLLAVPAWTAPQRSALVLSITEEGKQQDSLRTQVGELVQRAGARVIAEGSLSSSARACAEPTCLGKLASEHRVELILAARISRQSRHDRMIDMWIYDAKSGKEQSGKELCDARDMKDCVTGLAGKLIGPQLTEPVPTAAAVSTPKVAAGASASGSASVHADALVTKGALPPLKPLHESPPFPRWRIGLGVGLGVLAVGAAVTAIATQKLNPKQIHDFIPCNDSPFAGGCGYASSVFYVPAAVAAGVLGVGAILTFTLPRNERKESR